MSDSVAPETGTPNNPTIYIAIPVHGRIESTVACLRSIAASEHREVEVLICDDGSPDETARVLNEDFPWVRVFTGDGNLWWAGATNRCVEYALQVGSATDLVFTLNNDVTIEPNLLGDLVNCHRENPGSLIGTIAVYPDDPEKMVSGETLLNWVTARKGHKFPVGHHVPASKRDLVEVPKLPGKGTLIPLSVFKEIGLYDEERFPQYAADDDLSIRARKAGYRLLMSYGARVYNDHEKTGIGTPFTRPDPREFIQSLTSIRSPNNLKVRFAFAWKHCPKYLLPTFVVLDTARLIGSFLRRYLMRPNRIG